MGAVQLQHDAQGISGRIGTNSRLGLSNRVVGSAKKRTRRPPGTVIYSWKITKSGTSTRPQATSDSPKITSKAEPGGSRYSSALASWRPRQLSYDALVSIIFKIDVAPAREIGRFTQYARNIAQLLQRIYLSFLRNIEDFESKCWRSNARMVAISIGPIAENRTAS